MRYRYYRRAREEAKQAHDRDRNRDETKRYRRSETALVYQARGLANSELLKSIRAGRYHVFHMMVHATAQLNFLPVPFSSIELGCIKKLQVYEGLSNGIIANGHQ